MKVCLSCWHNKDFMKNADEVKIDYNLLNNVFSFYELYPEITIILEHKSNLHDNINWKELKKINILCKNNLILCADTIDNCRKAIEEGIKSYHSSFVTNAYELNALKELGVCYVLVDAPIFFKMDILKNSGISVRVIPNLAQKDGLFRKDGVCGSWIRPEDMPAYAEYVDTVEFYTDPTDTREEMILKEKTLYNIYFKQQEWPGDLDYLIQRLDHRANNRLIGSEFSRKRLNCGQRCQEGTSCHMCYLLLNLADIELIQEYKTS